MALDPRNINVTPPEPLSDEEFVRWLYENFSRVRQIFQTGVVSGTFVSGDAVPKTITVEYGLITGIQ